MARAARTENTRSGLRVGARVHHGGTEGTENYWSGVSQVREEVTDEGMVCATVFSLDPSVFSVPPW